MSVQQNNSCIMKMNEDSKLISPVDVKYLTCAAMGNNDGRKPAVLEPIVNTKKENNVMKSENADILCKPTDENIKEEFIKSEKRSTENKAMQTDDFSWLQVSITQVCITKNIGHDCILHINKTKMICHRYIEHKVNYKMTF